MKKKIAIILSGCGVYDGAEIHESVLTMLAVLEIGGQYKCFAPDITQYHVINHLNGEVIDQNRNVLQESARIARGEIQPLSELNVDDFDALILPGGFGAAKNLCNFAFEGSAMDVEPGVLSVCKAFAQAGKVAGYACIAPVIMAKVYPAGVELTIGDDPQTAQAVSEMGASHAEAKVDQVVIDQSNKVVSTPAYMLANNLLEAKSSINAMVSAVFKLLD
jgi:enhancing lycopene biosynthesis protein 2